VANTVYTGYRNALLGVTSAFVARPNILADTVRALFVDHTAFQVDPTTHDALIDITAGRVTGTTAGGPALTGRTVTNGTFTASPTTFSSVTGEQPDSLTIYKEISGSESTSMLLIFFDTPSGNFPVPNGGDILINWSGSGIASI
jgi:hypothetical protein